MRAFAGPFLYWSFSMLANVFNWLFNVQAGRVLAGEAVATLSVLLSIQYLINVPANSLALTVARYTAFYSEKGEREKHFHFFRQYWWFAWFSGIVFVLVSFLSRNAVGGFFAIHPMQFFLFSLMSVPLFLLAFERGVLSGQLAFVWVGVLFITEAGTKYLLMGMSAGIPFPGEMMAVAAVPLSLSAAWLLSVFIGRSFHPLPVMTEAPKTRSLSDTYRFLGYSFFAGLGSVLIYNIDILLVKHYFPAAQAGEYSMLTLMGKTLFFGAGSLISLIIPITARAVGSGRSGRREFAVLFAIIAGAGCFIWLSYILAPEFMVKTLLTSRGLGVLPHLPAYSLGMLFLVMASCFTTYSLAKKNYLPTRITLFAALAEAVLIVLYHENITQVVNTVSFTMFALFAAVAAVEAFGITGEAVSNNIGSLLRLFAAGRRQEPGRGMRILILNWRDTKHVRAGGAEVYIHESGNRLARDNCRVTLFTANDGRSAPEETIDGMHVIRRGGFVTVYGWALLYYLFRFRGKFDVIVDSENGVPFFAPLYAGVPVVLLVHHVHRDIFFRSLVPPFSWIAHFLETYLMSWVYAKCKIIAVSPSTADALVREVGLRASSVIPNGVDKAANRRSEKSAVPLVSYLGRLAKYKSVDVLIRSFAMFRETHPSAQLVVAGAGEEEGRLRELAAELGLDGSAAFPGRIGELEKNELLSRSWVMVQPSYMEGWGISCIEANACGTPVCASRVPGLWDAVSEGVSGMLFDYGDSRMLAGLLRRIADDEALRTRMSETARIWSEQFEWDRQSRKMRQFLMRAMRPGKEPGRMPVRLKFAPSAVRK